MRYLITFLQRRAHHAGLFQLAIDSYALSHTPSVQPPHAWELRKSLAVLAEMSTIFQRAEAASMDMLCTQDARKLADEVQSM